MSEKYLLKLLNERAFKRGNFELASGVKSGYYIDARMCATHSISAQLIGKIFYQRSKDLIIDAVGGMAVGAVPLVTSTVIAYNYHGREKEGFYVRDGAKDHGLKKTIEGNLPHGSRVMIVDDVINTGESTIKAIKAVQQIRCEVALVLALVDRLNGAERACIEQGAKRYMSIYTIRDFGINIPDKKEDS